MNATITIPAELAQRITRRATAQRKRFEQMAVEMLEMTLDQLEDYEVTETSLEQVRVGKVKPIREFLEELRQDLGFR